MNDTEPRRPPGTTDAVRGARTTGRVRWILLISLLLVVVGFLVSGFLTR